MRGRMLLAFVPFILAACAPQVGAVIYTGKYKRDDLQRLSDRGDPYAMMMLAEYNYRGTDGPQNREEAARLYAASAKQGNLLAQERLDAMQRGDLDIGLAHDIMRRWRFSAAKSEAPKLD